MEFKENCTILSTDTKIKCEENKRKIIFNNTKREIIKKIIVDGCQITDGIRCDFLIVNNKKEYFVELKGEDIRKGIEQLIRTIQILGVSEFEARICYVISSRSPLNSAEIQNIRLNLRRKYKTDLIIKNKNCEVEL